MCPFFKPDVKKMREKKDIDGLINALKDKDVGVRMNAAYALGDMGDIKAVEPLIEALKDVWGVKLAAATALGNLHDERAIEPLEALKTGTGAAPHSGLETKAAAVALARIKRDVPRLIEALETEPELASRVAAIKELGKLGDGRAVDPLIKMFNKPYYDEFERGNIHYQIIIALGNLGDERAIEPITRALRDNVEIVRKAAEEALKKIKPHG